MNFLEILALIFTTLNVVSITDISWGWIVLIALVGFITDES